MSENRVLMVSHRLPVTVQAGPGADIVQSTGGLARGLGRWHAQSEGRWFGWPGDGAVGVAREECERQLAAQRLVPLFLTPSQVAGYYDGFANRVLWPLFHYRLDQLPTDAAGWEAYREVNEAFADAVAREYRPHDLVWVHDYHLMLVPALLRARLPHARIGFFLHIPFPSSEVFRVLPRRRELLNGLLGADLIGFHTFAYMRHFMTSLLHVDGVEADVDRIHIGGRDVKLGVFPMGVDVQEFERLAADPAVGASANAIRREAGGRCVVLGIDRLDYTKGIPRRLDAIESLLARHPELRGRIRYIQVAVPTREKVDAYRDFKKYVEERVGRINGAYGTFGSLPVHYMYRSVSPEDLVALYRAADIMLVTPLRDGMNLVAKEFVASRVDDDGVLVLSEFAGAAAELNGAITVNPYDIDGVADSIRRAAMMPTAERRARMQSLRQRVVACNVHDWANGFVDELKICRPVRQSRQPALPLTTLLRNARRSGGVRLLLDYDGTLVPLARSPELAAPDGALMTLLDELTCAPGIQVDIVSGRDPQTLEEWFGALPVSIWAEHGYWHRPNPGAGWTPTAMLAPGWINRIKPILDQFTAATPGARVEVKTASVAWHYRGAPRDFGARQAHELRLLLGDLLSNQPLEVLEGNKVIEVRAQGVSKALVARHAAAESGTAPVIVAIGDDQTDEEMFRALPASGIAIAVGRTRTAARFQLDDSRGVRQLLSSLIAPETRRPARVLQYREPAASA